MDLQMMLLQPTPTPLFSFPSLSNCCSLACLQHTGLCSALGSCEKCNLSARASPSEKMLMKIEFPHASLWVGLVFSSRIFLWECAFLNCTWQAWQAHNVYLSCSFTVQTSSLALAHRLHNLRLEASGCLASCQSPRQNNEMTPVTNVAGAFENLRGNELNYQTYRTQN